MLGKIKGPSKVVPKSFTFIPSKAEVSGSEKTDLFALNFFLERYFCKIGQHNTIQNACDTKPFCSCNNRYLSKYLHSQYIAYDFFCFLVYVRVNNSNVVVASDAVSKCCGSWTQTAGQKWQKKGSALSIPERRSSTRWMTISSGSEFRMCKASAETYQRWKWITLE